MTLLCQAEQRYFWRGGVEYDAVVQMIAASMQKMEALGAEPETIKLCKPG